MINKVFFLFPGQGAQYPGMALDLLESCVEIKRLFSLASEITGKDMEDLLRNSSAEELKKTDVSQPAITLANLAAAKYLEIKLFGKEGIKPSGCAGFSLGEYAALAVAGVISEEDCFSLVTLRGKAMQTTADNIKAMTNDAPGMAAVIGLAPSLVEELITKWKNEAVLNPGTSVPAVNELYAANINSPRQVAVSGSAAALKEAEKLFKEAGARRVIPLQVACPFHSPLMKEAADAFAPALEKVTFKDPVIPIFSNVTGKQIKSGSEAKALALRQIAESVRWTEVESSIAQLKPDALFETGPGNVLEGLWKDTGSQIPCYAAGTVAEIDELFILP